VVSALARIEGQGLAQVATAGKGHELAAIPDVLALNLLRVDTTAVSLKVKRKRLGWNDHYLEDLLARIAKCV
jgi:hypothetical protein